MTQSLTWTCEGDKLVLAGELDQDVLNLLWDARTEAMKGVFCTDLNQVSRADTGGLALLLHLVNRGKQQGNSVSLTGVNDEVYTLAQLYNLPDDVLPRQLYQTG